MVNLKKLQTQIYQNKIEKGFNTTDVYKEFCLVHEEVAEACRAHYKKLPDVGEELADVVIYILGLAEILNVDLESELLKKVEKNRKRVYKRINGVNTRIQDA
jgi:NTP pyrophosphatase (non-canonical NTP hydrolase)